MLGIQVATKTWPAMLNKEGWLELEPTQSDLRGMRGTFILGCIFTFLAIMNFLNTVAVITDKKRYQKQRCANITSSAVAGAKAAGSRKER